MIARAGVSRSEVEVNVVMGNISRLEAEKCGRTNAFHTPAKYRAVYLCRGEAQPAPVNIFLVSIMETLLLSILYTRGAKFFSVLAPFSLNRQNRK
jgi:hypothetical protein